MNFTNRLKGSVTQALVRSLLTDAGLTVVPLGIEEVIREVADLEREKYCALGLPEPLRFLPDFFAANHDRTSTWLIEVKFRRTWCPAVKAQLGEDLERQVEVWSPLFLILFLGETPSRYPRYPSSWVRVAKLSKATNDLRVEVSGQERPWAEVDYLDLDRVQDVFPGLNDPAKWDSRVLQATLSVSTGLAGLP